MKLELAKQKLRSPSCRGRRYCRVERFHADDHVADPAFHERPPPTAEDAIIPLDPAVRYRWNRNSVAHAQNAVACRSTRCGLPSRRATPPPLQRTPAGRPPASAGARRCASGGSGGEHDRADRSHHIRPGCLRRALGRPRDRTAAHAPVARAGAAGERTLARKAAAAGVTVDPARLCPPWRAQDAYGRQTLHGRAGPVRAARQHRASTRSRWNQPAPRRSTDLDAVPLRSRRSCPTRRRCSRRPIEARSGWRSARRAARDDARRAPTKLPLPRPLIAEQVGHLLGLATGFHEPRRAPGIAGSSPGRLLQRIESGYADPDLRPNRRPRRGRHFQRYLQNAARRQQHRLRPGTERHAPRPRRATCCSDPRAAGCPWPRSPFATAFSTPATSPGPLQALRITPREWRAGHAPQS